MTESAISPASGDADTGTARNIGAATSPLPVESARSVRGTWVRLVVAVLLTASALLIFVIEAKPLGIAVLALAVAAGFWGSRAFGIDLALIFIGATIMGLVPVTTDISIEHMLVMGAGMTAAIAIPYLLSRYVVGDHAIRFPVNTGQRWSRREIVWVVAVPLLGYLILPVYMIRSGVYENWPAATDVSSIARLFLGTNVLGIWDELFFVCTVFALLRRHFPDSIAMVLQAVFFTSFLFELGFTSWGPLLIFPFALVQAYTFRITKSLSYIVTVHLLFDFVLFLVLLHAHDRSMVPIFIY